MALASITIIPAEAAVLFRILLTQLMTSRPPDVISHYCDAQNSVAHAWSNVRALCKSGSWNSCCWYINKAAWQAQKVFKECSVATGVTYISWETKELRYIDQPVRSTKNHHEATTVWSRHHKSSQQWTELSCSDALHTYGGTSYHQGRWKMQRRKRK